MQSKGILTHLLDAVEKVFNSIRYNGFYIVLSLLFPYIIFKLDAGVELVRSMIEDHAYLNIVLTLVSFSILGFSIWCIPVLGIELFVKIFPSLGKDRKHKICLLEQLTDIYNGVSRKPLSETNEKGEKRKADLVITNSQIPIRYLAILPWALFVFTVIKSFFGNMEVLVAMIVLITILIILRLYPKWIIAFFDRLLDGQDGKEKRKRYVIFLSGLFALAFLIYLILYFFKPIGEQIKYWLPGINFFGLIFFYSYLLFMEQSKHHQADSRTGYFRTGLNHSLLIVYLVIAIVIFYALNQTQTIQYLSPVIIITTMSSALIVFFELVFTSQFLLMTVVTDNKCPVAAHEGQPEGSFKSHSAWLKVYKYFLILLVLWVVNLYFLSSSNTHDIRKYPAKGIHYTDKNRLELSEYFDRWLRHSLVQQDSTIYLISGQGGGSRAAAWFYMNMAKMETLDSTFYKHVFSLSTISGSTSGADMYLAAKHHGVHFKSDSILAQGEKLYGVNYMSSAFFGLLLGDAIESVFDKFDDFPRDRNYHLQEEEKKAFENTFGRKDSSFFNNDYLRSYTEDTASPPPLFLINTAIVNFGTRGVFCPVKMSGFSFARDLYGEFKKENCNSGFDLPMVTCVNQSEAFPIISSYNYMDCVGRFVDGGLYDNSGCTTTLELYQALRRYCDTSGMPNMRFICLNIINGNIEEEVIAPYQNASILNTVTAAYQSPFSGHQAFAYKNLEREIKYLQPNDKFISIKLNPSITLTRTLSDIAVKEMYGSMDSSISKSSVKTFLKLAP
ncbi:MAG: hypothetical protein QM768_20235 [Agriterribacter sp.]